MFEEIGREFSIPARGTFSSLQGRSTDSTVLITGETGTAKSCSRAPSTNVTPFFASVCQRQLRAISGDLIASELFGHEKGAFTGATHRRPGRLSWPEGGTIFLDEVGELPARTQIACCVFCRNMNRACRWNYMHSG